jgi:hypothetical protein
VNLAGTSAAVAVLSTEPMLAAVSASKIKAIAFDGLTVFDTRSVAALAEQVFPGRGKEMSALWRTRQFEYTWLRTLGRRYGGPRLPVLNWSKNHGDLRAAHFLGLYGIQIIPLIGWWLLRRKRLSELQRTRLIWLASGTYVSCFTLLGWQALRGQAVIQPDRTTLVMASLLALFTGTGSWLTHSSSAFSGLEKWAALEVRS